VESGWEQERRASFWLAPHAYSARCARHGVLRDVRHNRGVAVRSADSLAGWLGGWPAPDGGQRDGPPSALASRHEQSLRVTERRVGDPVTAPQIEEPTRTRLEFDFAERPAPRVRDLVRLARAWAAACASLVRCSLHAEIERVRDGGTGRERPGEPVDGERARARGRPFVHLRPCSTVHAGASLLDSLTLLRFLAGDDLHPLWILGVRTTPFPAHCRLQRGPVRFNDLPDRVRQDAPILQVEACSSAIEPRLTTALPHGPCSDRFSRRTVRRARCIAVRDSRYAAQAVSCAAAPSAG
jgi:hypothetical protein